MFKIKKGIILISLVIVLSIFTYYWYATQIIQSNKEGVVPTVPVAESRKVSAIVKYMATEEKEDELRFVLTLDKDGVITDLTTLDAKTNEVPEKKKAFNEAVSTMIKGKKLSELTAIDKVAKSTLTTAAFNSVIDQLKAQL